MNYMKQVAEILGLEWDDEKGESEEFNLCDGGMNNPFKITTYGLEAKGLGFDGWLRAVLTGKALIQKMPWRPKDGEDYWYATVSDYCKAYVEEWNGDMYHRIRHKRGLVFKTQEEATARTDEILKLMGVDVDGENND